MKIILPIKVLVFVSIGLFIGVIIFPNMGGTINDENSRNYFCTNLYLQKDGWNTTFGGSNIDVGHSVQQTTDEGYIITGYTRSYGVGGRNIWLIKTDNAGNEEWNNTFGGNNDDEGESVIQTSDGGYIITGYTNSFGAGLDDVWLVKTDNAGNEEWNNTFGGSNDDRGTSVLQTSDCGYIIAGHTLSFGTGGVDVWLIKTDESGNEEWNKTLGGYSSDGAWSINLTSDGGYIITGWTYSYGVGYLGNVWLIKTDDFGNEEWNKAFGGTDVDRGYSVQQTTDEGYIIAGYTSSFGAGLDDVLLIKTDASGNEQWNNTFGGANRDYGYSVYQTSDGGYIITGYTMSFGAGGDDIWLIKTDGMGNELFNNTYGGTYSDVGYSVIQTSDGGYIITGHTLSYGAGVHDVWLIKTAINETSFSLSVLDGWNFISLPFNKSVEKVDIFVFYNLTKYYWDDAVINGYINDYIFGWNRNSQSYNFAYILEPGYGFWIYAYEPCELWIENITVTPDNYITDLDANWNIVGLSYDQPVVKTNIMVNDILWDDAVATDIISDYVFGWERVNQSYIFADTFLPGYAYWLYSYQPCKLKRAI